MEAPLDLELISFNICPFVQRSVITLLHKGVDHKITYIDLASPPDWFLAISPLGKVPILRVKGETALFESAVINEYIDEVTPNPMMPADALTRGVHRGWIEFCSGCLVNMFMALMAKTQEAYEEKCQSLAENLARLETIVQTGPFFAGNQLALIDFAYAPLFTRLDLINRRQTMASLDELPKVSGWSESLIKLDEVKKSVVPEFEELFIGYIKKSDSYAANLY